MKKENVISTLLNIVRDSPYLSFNIPIYIKYSSLFVAYTSLSISKYALTVPVLVRVTDGVEDPPLQVPGATSKLFSQQ